MLWFCGGSCPYQARVGHAGAKEYYPAPSGIRGFLPYTGWRHWPMLWSAPWQWHWMNFVCRRSYACSAARARCIMNGQVRVFLFSSAGFYCVACKRPAVSSFRRSANRSKRPAFLVRDVLFFAPRIIVLSLCFGAAGIVVGGACRFSGGTMNHVLDIS